MKRTFTIETRLSTKTSSNLIKYFHKLVPYYQKIFITEFQKINKYGIYLFKKNESRENTYLQYEYKISKRMASSILNEAKGRFQALSELKNTELKQLEI